MSGMPHTIQRESSLRQRSVQRGWIFEREEVPSHSTALIVDHGGEPRLGNLAVRTDQQNVERGVVGLPDRIRCVRFAPMNQFESVAVRLRSLMRKGHQIGW